MLLGFGVRGATSDAACVWQRQIESAPVLISSRLSFRQSSSAPLVNLSLKIWQERVYPALASLQEQHFEIEKEWLHPGKILTQRGEHYSARKK